MIKILIVDDHLINREGLKRILAESSDIVIEDEAGSGHEAINKVWENDFDLILLHIFIPGRGGLDILKRLKSIKPKLPVLILSAFPEAQYGVRVLKAGASGCLTKENTPEELIKAIKEVSIGKKYINPSIAEKLAFNLDIFTEKPPHEMLSDREYEVMCLIASGKTIKEIAKELSLSEKTINKNRVSILQKMKLKNNVEIISYSIKQGLVA